MNKLKLTTALAICVGMTGAQAIAASTTLQDLLDGATISDGPLTFYDFNYDTASPLLASEITVRNLALPEGHPTGNDIYGLEFGGPFVALPNTTWDINLGYSVMTDGPGIQSLHAAVAGGFIGANGQIAMTELVTERLPTGPVFLGRSSVGLLLIGGDLIVDDPIDPPGEAGDVLMWDPVDTIRVVKNFAWGAGDDTLTDATNFYQAFDVVPEPHEYAMLAGLGLIGFAAYRRMRA